jgi:hypothetical protein
MVDHERKIIHILKEQSNSANKLYLSYSLILRLLSVRTLKVHKIEIFFGFDFEICNISLLLLSKY